MMNWGNFPEDVRQKMWAYVTNNATQHDVILTTRSKQNSYKLFWGNQPNYIGNLKWFGETGTVKTLIKGNMVSNRGFTGVCVGYPEDHAAGTYLVMNMKTRHVCRTRTVDWNNESYGETMKIEKDKRCHLPFETYEDND